MKLCNWMTILPPDECCNPHFDGWSEKPTATNKLTIIWNGIIEWVARYCYEFMVFKIAISSPLSDMIPAHL